MSTTYRFLAVDDEADAPLTWFRGQPDPPEVIDKPGGHLLYFRDIGPLAQAGDGLGIDVRRSPLVSVIRPKLRRGVLWSAGEVHFLPSSLRRAFPPLHALNLHFVKWLSDFDRVLTCEPGWSGEWNYWLEGSIRNYDSEVFALPRAMEALRTGQYLVGEEDGEGVLDILCRSLRHRGVECRPDASP